MISCFLFEVPTGVVADVFGRKTSFLASCFFLGLSFFIYYLSGSLALFITAEVVGAIGHTLHSGAFKAWMIDEVNLTGEGFDLTRAYRSGKVSSSVGIFLGVIVGGYLGEMNIALPWLYSAMFILATGIIGYFIIKENSREKVIGIGNFQLMIDTAREGARICRINRDIMFVISLGFIWNFSCMALNMYWQILYQGFGLEIGHLGWLFSGITLCAMFGTLSSGRVFGFFKSNRSSLFFTIVLMSLGMYFAGTTKNIYFSLPMFYIHQIARGLYEPLLDDYLNKRIDDKTRATVLSFYSMTATFGAFWGLLVTGMIAKNFSIEASWIFSALVIFFFFLFSIIKKKE